MNKIIFINLIHVVRIAGLLISTNTELMTNTVRYYVWRKQFSFLHYYVSFVTFDGEGWYLDGRERESVRWLKWHKGAMRHPRGVCGNATWRLHYFWGEKCPFLLEDSSPRATRARLVKILRTAYKPNWERERESPLSPFPFAPSISLVFFSIPRYLQSSRLCLRRD